MSSGGGTMDGSVKPGHDEKKSEALKSTVMLGLDPSIQNQRGGIG
jgi:hypothetical protein